MVGGMSFAQPNYKSSKDNGSLLCLGNKNWHCNAHILKKNLHV